MLNRLSLPTVVMISLATSAPTFADEHYTSCAIEVAIAVPPVTMDEHVVFNITSERGTSRSVTLQGGSAPFTFSDLICSSVPYTISATRYSYPTTPSKKASESIGQCSLKAGLVVLNEAYNSVSVVYPHDFICN